MACGGDGGEHASSKARNKRRTCKDVTNADVLLVRYDVTHPISNFTDNLIIIYTLQRRILSDESPNEFLGRCECRHAPGSTTAASHNEHTHSLDFAALRTLFIRLVLACNHSATVHLIVASR